MNCSATTTSSSYTPKEDQSSVCSRCPALYFISLYFTLHSRARIVQVAMSRKTLFRVCRVETFFSNLFKKEFENMHPLFWLSPSSLIEDEHAIIIIIFFTPVLLLPFSIIMHCNHFDSFFPTSSSILSTKKCVMFCLWALPSGLITLVIVKNKVISLIKKETILFFIWKKILKTISSLN